MPALLVDLPQLAEAGADGIGLFRTELQFMVASTFPRAEEQEALLSRRARRGARQAGHLPHHRHRRRQGAALFQGRRAGREPGARLARHPADARPAGPAAHADPRAAQGCRRARAEADAADGDRARRDRAGARDHRQRGAASVALRPSSADQPEARRDAGSAVAAVAARRADGGGRFRLGRLERSVPVRHGDRSRQHASLPTASTRCRCRSCACCKQIADAGERNRHAGDAVRRTGRQADLGDGADRPRLPLDLDVAGLDRPGQGDADGTAAGRADGVLRRQPDGAGAGAADAGAAAGLRRRPLASRCKHLHHDQLAPRPHGSSRQAFRDARSADVGRAGAGCLCEDGVGICRAAGHGGQDPGTARGRA